MTVSVHNPDEYMASLRQIIAQGRKRIGLLVGAGAPAGIFPPGSDKPLIPAVAGLTDMVMEALKADYGKTLDAVWAELDTPNIETILSRVRSLASVIGKTKVHDLDGEGYKKLSEAICEQIGTIVNKPLHEGPTPYTEFVTWISGTGREHPVEIFTTNYATYCLSNAGRALKHAIVREKIVPVLLTSFFATSLAILERNPLSERSRSGAEP